MGNDQDDIGRLLVQLRAAVEAEAPAPQTLALLDHLEKAVNDMLAGSQAMQARLERPPGDPTLRRATPAHLEAWVRRLEQPGTANQ